MVGMGLVLAVWSLFFVPRPTPPPAVAQNEAANPAEDDAAPSSDDPPRTKIAPSRFDGRWLPDDTRLIVSLQASKLASQPQAAKLLTHIQSVWRKSGGAVLRAFGLRLDRIHRVTLASTDLAAWAEKSVIVIELEPGQDIGAVAASGQAVDLGTPNLAFRRLPGDAWPHPFAVLDDRTIVTGHEGLLRELAGRTEPHFKSGPIQRLLKVIVPEGDVTLLVDLAAARKARWQLPVALLDVWPAGKRPWRNLWEIPEGLACGLQWSGALRSELALLCEGPSAAESVRAAMDELVPAVRNALPNQIEALRHNRQAGRVKAEAADQYKLLVDEAVAAIQSSRWKAADGIVWVQMNWNQGPLAAAEAAVDSSSFMQAQWFSTALDADSAMQKRLIAELGGYAKAEGGFPQGAAGQGALGPETRLSWIAGMLPYYDHSDWHRSLDARYSWNSPQNKAVTQKPLPEVINPVLGPSTTAAGFPVTHYVGVAGVGPDAARLPADDPRAGVFGHYRKTRSEDITDGTSCTIAIMGVSGQLGPWGQGGHATVRPLTQEPYINGPDGFGSGQPDGMLVAMADGSVKFLPSNTDPSVIRGMATIRGGEVMERPAKPAEPPTAKPAAPKPEAPRREKPPVRPKPATPVQADPRLALTVPDLEFSGQALGDVVSTLSSIGNVPVSFDPDALQELGVTLRDRVSVKLKNATIGSALNQVLADRRLACVMDGGQLLVTSSPEHRETLRQITYSVSDLTGGDAQSLAALASLVQKLVVPESWQSSGGQGTIEPKDGGLVVTQTGNVHYRVIVFCEKLRTARGKPLRSKLDPELFALATRQDRARSLLGRPVTANYPDMPLAEILAALGKSTGVEMLLDRPSLAAEGIGDNPKATLKAQGTGLAVAVDEMLLPLHLAWRVVDAKTLQVTTKKVLDSRLEIEFYPVGDLLAKEPPEALMDRLKSRLGGAAWSESGGPGALYFDAPSKCLIVLHSQPVQIAIARVLAEKGN